MKRMLITLLLLFLLMPACAIAGTDYMLDIGPYTMDAAGCGLYEYSYSANLSVEYPALEAFRGFGIGHHYVNIQYYTHEELGYPYADLVGDYGTRNNWEIAYYELDYYYGKYSESEYFLSCTPEEVNPHLSPAGALFTCMIDEGDGGLMAGALLVTGDGILFLDCYSYSKDEAVTRAFRDNMLEKLYYNGEPVLTDTTDPDAPAVIPAIVTGEPVSLSVGYGAGYTIEVEGYTSVDASQTDTAVVFYDDMYLQLVYYSIDEVLSPTQANGLSDYDKALALYDLHYGYRIGGDDIAEMELENADVPLKYCGLTTEEYGGGYKIGAIVVNGDSLMVIDITAENAEVYYDDMDFLREDIIKGLKYGGSAD